ncbi:MAG: hypothetical protein B6244_07130 [Candidatus Cloacimonetes bacterium 4572_55]|nr:MAG: hypothetical protein B6244_07130 [Candidatus Cloacimonetes bacterium 4572_55]
MKSPKIVINSLSLVIIFLFSVASPLISSEREMQLEWDIIAGFVGGAIASPLLLDIYQPPSYPDLAHVGQEVFIPCATGANGRFYGLKSGGGYLYNSGYLTVNGILKSSPTAALFGDSRVPRVIFGSSDGLHILSPNGSDYVVSVSAGISSTPVLVNLNTNSDKEIVAIDDAGVLYAWGLQHFSLYPLPGFPIALGGSVYGASPAVGNINTGSFSEIVVATEHAVHVLDRFGNYLSGWPLTFESFVTVSPVIGKIDNFDTTTRNVIFATDDGALYVTRYNGGAIPGWPVQLDAPVDTSPIVVDLDMDGQQEVVVCTSDYRVHVLQADGQPFPGFPLDLSEYQISPATREERTHAIFNDPLALDVDGDGMIELLIPMVENGRTFSVSSYGSIESGWPVEIGRDQEGEEVYYSNLMATPAVSDIDYDGQLELVACTFGMLGGPGGDFSPPRIKCYGLATDPTDPRLKPWPMYRQNQRRTGEVSRGFDPVCQFPLQIALSPIEPLDIDFADYALDLDTPAPQWLCEIEGLDHINVNYLTNTKFRLDSNGWAGAETAIFRVTTEGRDCISAIQFQSGLFGDLDGDGELTVADVDRIVELLLDAEISAYELWAGDWDQNGSLTIRDLVLMVDWLARN